MVLIKRALVAGMTALALLAPAAPAAATRSVAG